MRSVYIVRCNDDTLYTGIAKDLEKRIFDHNNSKVGAKYTKSRRPVKLIWHKNVRDRVTASKLEYKLKRIGKEAKEKLVATKIKKKKSVKKSSCKCPK